MRLSDLLKRYKKIPLPAKASLWFIVCSVLQKGISLFTVPIFTRLLTTEQYGVYSTYLSWYQILLIFTSLNLFHGVFNNAMIKFENQRERYISSMQGLVFALTFALFCVYLCAKSFFNNILGMTTQIVLLLFVELLVTPALQFWTVYNRFEYKYKKIVFVTILKSILNPILGIIFVIFSEEKDLARIISVVLVELCVCGFIAGYQFYRGRCFYDKKFWKYAILFNLPLIPHYLSGSILSQSDRIMIGKMCGNSEVAFYSVAYNIGVLMNIIVNAVNASLTPWMYQKIRDDRAGEISKIANLLLVLMGGLIVVLIVFAPEAMYIIASSEYSQAVYVIPPVAASTFFYFMYNIFANVEFYYEERRFVLIASVTSAGLNILLNWIFIPIYGYYAAGYTTLICYILYGLSHLFFSDVVVKNNMQSKKVFDKKFIFASSIIVVLITIGLNFLYPYTLLRYSVILVFIIGCIVNRKKITNLLDTIRKR